MLHVAIRIMRDGVKGVYNLQKVVATTLEDIDLSIIPVIVV
jgi:hypothetical protein